MTILDQSDCPTRQRLLFMAIREGLRIILRAIEEYADLPRSFETQAERRNGRMK